MKSKMDGTNATTLVSTDIRDPCKSIASVEPGYLFCTHLADLAVDWISRKIYWADASLKKIEVMDMNGGNRKIILNALLASYIVVDPTTGLVLL